MTEEQKAKIKAELLQKGISGESIDLIIATNSDTTSPILELQKALGNDSSEDLAKAAKAKEEEDEEEKDDYNEGYMKKNMPRYMKENKKACKSMATDVGLFEEKMKKAIDNIDMDSEGAVVEMTDLAPYLKSQGEIMSGLFKAVADLAGQVDIISDNTGSHFELMKKAAAVQVEQSTALDKFLTTPQGRKSAAVIDMPMQKAQPIQVSQANKKIIHAKLMKAVQNKDRKAGQVISAFESSGQDVNALKPEDRQYIGELMTATEAK